MKYNILNLPNQVILAGGNNIENHLNNISPVADKDGNVEIMNMYYPL